MEIPLGIGAELKREVRKAPGAAFGAAWEEEGMSALNWNFL